MITALEGIDEKVKALNLGADEFISKPFNKLELLARIRTLLRVKYLHDELAHANQKLLEQHKVLEGERKIAREVQEGVTSSLPLPLIRD
jgi:sigma-B regulation protein RsbU (phosphoserine phosphatase)